MTTLENKMIFANSSEFKIHLFKDDLEQEAMDEAVTHYDLRVDDMDVDCWEIVGDFTNLSENVIDYNLGDVLESYF